MSDKHDPKSPADAPEQEEIDIQSYLIHGRHFTEKWDFRHHIIPPQSSSVTYRLDGTARGAKGFAEYGSGQGSKQEPIYIYDRLDEPTRGMLEDELATVEGGEVAVAFATGMAAVSAALGVLLKSGDQVIAHRALYGCTYSLLQNWYPRLGIDAVFTDLHDPATLEAVITEATRVVYFETPVNPTLEILDIGGLQKVVAKHNLTRAPEDRIRIVVDNTFSTPFCQRPLQLGADLVVHSLTKNIGGFGTDMGGVVIGPAELEGQLLLYRKDFGGALAPKSAWPMLVYGLPTLPLRVKQQMQTAYEVARFLRGQPRVTLVRFPGLEDHPDYALAKRQMRDPSGAFAPANMIYFEVEEDEVDSDGWAATPTRTVQLVDWIAQNAYTITLAVSLGQLRTLIENPGAMTHAALDEAGRKRAGIRPNAVRLSIGIEAAADLIRDLKRAFAQLED